ncbi:hypothetical protein Cme02nite_65560 [Catellatospora methionotrophica]|uniref:Uncharacterized protein n=1 Tax=Catellatospora methionotrophica TaxID=121620 RepID=A0A8J3LG54_9ACTN|nr:hypothetical protein Cme02nite_65560 [Catellatospora methionotrophica]
MTVGMQPDGNYPSAVSTVDGGDPLAKLIDSARGWHGVQLGVLGFIGFCGVLKMGAEAPGPAWLQWLATGGSVGAFVTALWSIVMVGQVAWPTGDPSAPADPVAMSGRLRTGIRTTIAAVAMMAFAGLSAWWPTEQAPSVEVSLGNGSRACGEVAEGAPAGAMWLNTAAGETLEIHLTTVANVRPVASC